ncbi:MtnX-like HAD-IB family phosphatase [Methylotenera versatilis]|uniref:2,3-diketo-5-methylthio-1-phosphopentane phosphatase n=1 Tax=Methylotenera versatilis (strain 301) TaxID=666681 RepID=D7DJC8_METV0|nr:MtnX-like HAD-IB family phosphatase [Methylotenera versatilis]ADI30163.1 2,3-diketo-5-methylthio-1-phosphopentane phosphatase [Methylotenera versatilis 301]
MLFVIDFDGTLSVGDTVDAMLERFADDRWKDLEDEWLEGNITAIECMKQQLDLVEVDQVTLENFFRGIQLDASFIPFHKYISQFSKVAIVSDGLDHAIDVATRNAAIPEMPIYANKLTFKPNGVSISYPYRNLDCKAGNGVCKCQIAEQLSSDVGGPVVLIGDGKSDYCLAKHADIVFAKGKLITHCEQENIPFRRFQTFAEVLDVVKKWDSSKKLPARALTGQQVA